MDLESKQKIYKAIETAPSDAALSAYFLKLSKAFSPHRYDDKTITMREAMRLLIEDEKPRFKLELKSEALKSLSSFFFLTSGLHIIGAPTGHGKTMWAMKWAEEAALQNIPVLILSLEMTARDLSARSLAQETELSLMQLVGRDFTPDQKLVLKGLIDSESFKYFDHIHLETFGDYDWVKIYPRLLDRMFKIRPKLIILDYVQMLSNSENEDRRSSQILSDIARELKLFADETDSAALVLSQFNREAIKEIKRIKLDHLARIPLSEDSIKESGGITEAADSVQLVCMPPKIDGCPDHLRDVFQVSVAKSRILGLLGDKLFPFDYLNMKFK